eukprot:2613856-Pleurochrysis_carterae.AAC.1
MKQQRTAEEKHDRSMEQGVQGTAKVTESGEEGHKESATKAARKLKSGLVGSWSARDVLPVEGV